jgi:cysteine desulfurase / selenocysteine lyase
MHKELFPFFHNYPTLVYLDSAATALKPQAVIDAEIEYLTLASTNLSRGLYPLAEHTSQHVDVIRRLVASFIKATPEEIIFTSGTTSGLNMLALLLEDSLTSDDTLVVTDYEHHANYLPWKELAKRKRAKFQVLKSNPEGTVSESELLATLTENTAIVALSALSNVTGIVQDMPRLIASIREIVPHAVIVVDAAQYVAHSEIDVRKWDADFVVFSAHKLYGPTGIGVLYGKKEFLRVLKPRVYGGGIVLDACSPDTLYKDSPECFEAGTQNISGIFALGAAIDFTKNIGYETLTRHDQKLQKYTQERLLDTFGNLVTLIGGKDYTRRAGILSFVIEGIHPHDIATLLGEKDICVRAGEHCAQPWHRSHGYPATTRLSFGLYNSTEDIDTFITTMIEIVNLLKK